MLLSRRNGFAFLLTLLLAAPAWAQAEQPEGEPPPPSSEEPAKPVETDESSADTRVSFRMSYYEQHDENGTEGNPFHDEALMVVEPILIVEHQVTEDVAVTARLTHDFVSAASIKRLDNFPQQSGASNDYHFSGELTVAVDLTDDLRVGITAHGGFERDYTIGGGRLDAAFELPDDNTTLSMSLVGYRDEVIKIRFNGSNDGAERRITMTLNLGVYRVLTPWLHGSLGYTFTRQEGFLETNFNSVVLENQPGARSNPLLVNAFRGVEISEELPGHRLRHTVHGRIRAYIPTGTSLELRARFYGDSWDVYSWSLEPRLYQWIVEGLLMGRVRYRYYSQEASEHFEENFVSETFHRTQDPDLADLESHTLGIKLILYLDDLLSDGYELDAAVDYIWRSDELDGLMASAGLRLLF